jgi:membrane protease YdiL (CAAX protease family)
MAKALLILLTAGLVWQFVLTMVLLRRELGTLRWSRVREALWLRAPRNPRSGRVGGRVWWLVLPFIVLFAAKEFVPGLSGPAARDFATFMESGGGEDFFRGAWVWFAMVVALSVFNTVLGEELLFRGFLLPRMRGVFGKWDFVANGVLFAAYHLHVPWVIPRTLVDTFALAYPSRRFQSAWMGIIVHSVQSLFFVLVVLAAVLA